MKSAEKRTVTSDLEEEEDFHPKKKGRLIRNAAKSSDDEGVVKQTKKRLVIDESDDDNKMKGTTSEHVDIENRNLPNEPIVKANQPAKGRRKVMKSRTYIDEKGYMVNEDYSSYEEFDLPPANQVVKKEAIKKVVQHNLT